MDIYNLKKKLGLENLTLIEHIEGNRDRGETSSSIFNELLMAEQGL